jgi:hypothetical protein
MLHLARPRRDRGKEAPTRSSAAKIYAWMIPQELGLLITYGLMQVKRSDGPSFSAGFGDLLLVHQLL